MKGGVPTEPVVAGERGDGAGGAMTARTFLIARLRHLWALIEGEKDEPISNSFFKTDINNKILIQQHFIIESLAIEIGMVGFQDQIPSSNRNK